MDLELPAVNGREATAEIASSYPQTRVIILSMHTGQDDVVQALQAGAAGFLPKFASDSELQLAIEAVMQGKTYISPHVSHHLAAYIRNDETSKENPLTPRQEEILKHIANGRSTKEIASQLNISIKTAETHRANIMNRLDMRDVASLVKYALKNGLVDA
jgi:DNA-binding NarL/FixJ family response regulator